MAAPVLESGALRDEPRDAASAGADLRAARERRGLSLEQLSRSTKITVKNLSNIETDRFGRLPAPVFLRGFLRAYAREVRLDPEETVRRYLNAMQPAPDASEPPVPPVVGPPDRLSEFADAIAATMRALPAAWLLVALLLAAAGYAITRGRGADNEQPPGRPSASTSSGAVSAQPSPATSREIGTAGSSDASIPPVPSALRIAIRIQGPCWVSATVDGARAVYRLMQSGETQTLEARQYADFRVGDAGAFTFSINGAPGRSLGRSGEPVNIRITKQNYTTLLADTGTTGR
jgi:cytoskeletal protein RodZ